MGPNSTGVRRCLLRCSAAQLETVPSPLAVLPLNRRFSPLLRRLSFATHSPYSTSFSFLIPLSHLSYLASIVHSHMDSVCSTPLRMHRPFTRLKRRRKSWVILRLRHCSWPDSYNRRLTAPHFAVRSLSVASSVPFHSPTIT